MADERTNAIVITTMPENFPMLEALIAELDVRTPQTLINILVAEATLTEQTKFGMENSWRWLEGRASSEFNVSETGVLAGLNLWLLKPGEDLESFINMLDRETQLNILSSPRVLASNGEKATVLVGDSVPILKGRREITGTTEFEFDYEYKDVAISIEVEPTINKDRDVSMAVTVLVEKIHGTVEAVTLEEPPKFAKREAVTQVVVKDGQTMVIAGLIKEDTTTSHRGLPFLRKVPILGALLGSREVGTEKTELMIFITPQVVTTVEEGEAVTLAEEASIDIEGTPNRTKADRYYERGREFYERGMYREAVNLWEEALRLYPHHLEAEYYLPEARVKLMAWEEKDKRRRERNRALDLEGMYEQAEGYYRQGRYAMAIAAWEGLLAEDPDSRLARQGIARARTQIERKRR